MCTPHLSKTAPAENFVQRETFDRWLPQILVCRLRACDDARIRVKYTHKPKNSNISEEFFLIQGLLHARNYRTFPMSVTAPNRLHGGSCIH